MAVNMIANITGLDYALDLVTKTRQRIGGLECGLVDWTADWHWIGGLHFGLALDWWTGLRTGTGLVDCTSA